MDTDEEVASIAVKNICQTLLSRLVLHLQKLVHKGDNDDNQSAPFVSGLQRHIKILTKKLISETSPARYEGSRNKDPTHSAMEKQSQLVRMMFVVILFTGKVFRVPCYCVLQSVEPAALLRMSCVI